MRPAASYLSILLVFLCANAFSQKEDRIWYFGGHPNTPTVTGAGLDFNSGSPVTLTNSAMPYTEGSAVQCDRYGSLLFYTNGETVWDKTHNIMQNGTGLCGGKSSEQSAVILPFPNDTTKYYLFANAGHPTAGGAGLFYSVIDVTLNSGKGAVTNTKCVPLLASTSEGMTATWHTNGTDYWLIVSEHLTNNLYSYQISSSGISTPVISTIISNFCTDVLKADFNTKGDRLSLYLFRPSPFNATRFISSFNQSTGSVFNTLYIDSMIGSSGACFSPNDNLLYYYGNNGGYKTLYQCDLTAQDIQASKIIIKQFSSGSFLDMKLGPDGKIYCNPVRVDSLDRINYPKVLGPGCGYEKNAIYLNGKKSGDVFPNRTFGKYLKPVGIKEHAVSNSITVFPNPSNNVVTMNTGDASGVYSVYDPCGRKIVTQSFKANQSLSIQLPEQAGLYFILVEDEKGNLYKKALIKK